MSRATTYDGDSQVAYLWEATAKRVFACAKGQAFLREAERALLAMPKQELHQGYLKDGDHVCVLGAVVVQRGIDQGLTRDEAFDSVPFIENEIGTRRALGLGRVMAWEFMYQNDGDEEYPSHHSPVERWAHCLKWIRSKREKKL